MKKISRRVRLIWTAAIGFALVLVSFGVAQNNLLTDKKEKAVMPLMLTSSSFLHGHIIPSRHTCYGVNVSPPLEWGGVPSGTQSLALIVDDPDAPDPAAPKMIWTHWVLYNIPPSVSGLAEGVAVKKVHADILSGVNDWHRADYDGPCPHVGQHRYFFTLYALDTVLPDMKYPNKATLEKSMQGHVLAHAKLIGLYQH